MTKSTHMVLLDSKNNEDGSTLRMHVMFLGDDDFADMWVNDPDVLDRLHGFDSTFSYEFHFGEYQNIKGMVGEPVYDDMEITAILEIMTLAEYGWDFTGDIKKWKESNA